MVRGPYSVRTHLLLVILGAVLPCALLTGVVVWRSLEDSRILIENRLMDATRVAADALDREFDGTVRVLQTLARSPLLEADDLPGFQAEAARAVRAQEGWFAVILLTADGQQLVHTDVPYGGPLRRVTEPESLRELVSLRTPVVGRLQAGQRDPKRRFPIRVPVVRDGRVRYALSAIVEPESLVPLVRSRLPATEEWTRTIVDPGGVIAARSRAAERFTGLPVTPTMAARINEAPPRPFRQTSMEGEELYSSLSRGKYGWTTVVAVPTRVLDAPARSSLVALLTGGAVLVVGALASVLAVSRRVSRDFKAARDAAAALAEGREPGPMPVRVAEARQARDSLQRASLLLRQRERERDEQLQQAVEARAHAEEASRTKDRFLAVLGHELRNPLAPATTALELMKLRGGSVLVREREVLERQVLHMTRLVNDLLDVSRLTRGKVELVRRRFELSAAVERSVDMARPVIDRHGQRLEVGVAAAGLPVNGDEDRVVQILVNLLTNAAKYTAPGGEITLRARADGDAVEITCDDNGPGISPDLLPTLFQPFAQGPRAIDRQQGGLGLGLALASSLAELHGGSVRYEPHRPRGSRFVVRLPLDSSPALAPLPVPAAVRPPMPARQLLLVEDNADARDMLRAALVEAGHTVHTAPDGDSAVALAAGFAPEVAILDIGLPGINGYDLAQRLRSLHPETRLIALTGYGQPADADAARRAGFDAHFTKPVTITALLDRIASFEAST